MKAEFETKLFSFEDSPRGYALATAELNEGWFVTDIVKRGAEYMVKLQKRAKIGYDDDVLHFDYSSGNSKVVSLASE